MRLNLGMSLVEAGVVMAEGNPGALTAIRALMEYGTDATVIDLAHLDDMEIYGSHIWVGYKDICKFDAELFREKIRDHSIKEELDNLPARRMQKGGGIRVYSGGKEI